MAGQHVNLRTEGAVAHVLAGGVLVRTVACPVPPEGRPRLRGARPGITVTAARTSSRGMRRRDESTRAAVDAVLAAYQTEQRRNSATANS